jgi:hypothetical protein
MFRYLRSQARGGTNLAASMVRHGHYRLAPTAATASASSELLPLELPEELRKVLGLAPSSSGQPPSSC